MGLESSNMLYVTTGCPEEILVKLQKTKESQKRIYLFKKATDFQNDLNLLDTLSSRLIMFMKTRLIKSFYI